METNPKIDKPSQEHVILSEEDQEDISFLNENTEDDSNIIIEEEIPPSPYQGIEDLEEILGDENKRVLIEKFEPGSLLDLQTIGLHIKECTGNDLLRQLALSTPAKIHFKTRELLSDMVLLVKPSLSTAQRIDLRVVPYIKQ